MSLWLRRVSDVKEFANSSFVADADCRDFHSEQIYGSTARGDSRKHAAIDGYARRITVWCKPQRSSAAAADGDAATLLRLPVWQRDDYESNAISRTGCCAGSGPRN